MAAAPETEHRLGEYVVTVSADFGPRVLGVRRHDGPEMFIRLGSEFAAGVFRLAGGHRLWASPEIPDITYAPDDAPVALTIDEVLVRLAGPIDAAGFSKEIEIRTGDDSLQVDHRLNWHGTAAISAAPWAITQLPLGGTAILPIGGPDGDGLQADRSLVVWPYTALTDPRLSFGSSHVTLHAKAAPRLKLGSGPDPGRLGYHRDGWLFTKTVTGVGDGAHADLGAVGQVFLNEDFCELETVGALVLLQPGEHADHRETWRIEPCPDPEAAAERILP